jgi:hypothetical protein
MHFARPHIYPQLSGITQLPISPSDGVPICFASKAGEQTVKIHPLTCLIASRAFEACILADKESLASQKALQNAANPGI